MRWVTGRVQIFFVVFIAVSFVASLAYAQRVGYRLQNRVPKGTKPSVVLQPGEDMQKIELILKRQDGRAEKHVRKNIKAGKEIVISFSQPEGSFDYEATLNMWTAAGQSSTKFKFDAVVAKRITVNVDKSKSVAEQALSTSTSDPEQEIKRLRKQMKAAASKLEFERAAELRDLIRELQALIVGA